MATTETKRYRGYDIVPMRQWSQWCVGIYPTRADLPILTRSTLSNLAAKKEDAVDEAKRKLKSRQTRRPLSHSVGAA
jgi:hypothetical protein